MPTPGDRISRIALRILPLVLSLTFTRPAAADGTLKVKVTDRTGQPIAARLHLRDSAGQAVRSLGMTDRLDHLAVDGETTLTIPADTYSYALERSPEWRSVEGAVTVVEGKDTSLRVSLDRLVDLSAKGWYSGDLHVHRDPDQIESLMRASDLHICPVITWWNHRTLWDQRPLPTNPLVEFDGNRFYHWMAGEDEREGGALLYFGMKEPLDITGAGREFPSPMSFVEQARRRHPGLHLEIEKPFWWDVPVWLALANPDSVGLANNHMCRDRMYETEAWGRPRDPERLPPPRGNGFWTQEIYYHILNAGFRLPPSAGSASGVLPNPLGYNRVYVHVPGRLTWKGWWEGLRQGRSFVSNGPLLVVTARVDGEASEDEHRPGRVLSFDGNGPHRVTVTVERWGTDPVPELELICNGRIVDTVACSGSEHQVHTLQLTCDEPGWFLVRAIADNPRTFRFASSAPFYVDVGERLHISRESCQFFLDWCRERIKRVPEKVSDPGEREDVLVRHRQAETFWMERLAAATAE